MKSKIEKLMWIHRVLGISVLLLWVVCAYLLIDIIKGFIHNQATWILCLELFGIAVVILLSDFIRNDKMRSLIYDIRTERDRLRKEAKRGDKK